MEHKLNGTGDLAMDGDIRPYIGTYVEYVKTCKSGLIQIRTHDGQLFSVPRRNLTPNTLATDRHKA